MARKFFGDSRPVGWRFKRAPSSGGGESYEVIGVVTDTKYRTVDEETRPIAYVSLKQRRSGSSRIDLQIRTSAGPTALIQPTVSLIEAVHPRISVRFSTLDDQVSASLARPRALAVLSGFFGVIALLLALIGLYGTLSHRVASRRNEIGLRLALGAGRTRVLGMVIGEVGRMVLFGIVAGITCTIMSTRVLTSFLFGVRATDPATLVLSAAILASVAFAAGVLPAWHAARLDPMETLREE